MLDVVLEELVDEELEELLEEELEVLLDVVLEELVEFSVPGAVRFIFAEAVPLELVAVAVKLNDWPGLRFTCAFLLPQAPLLSSLLKETAGFGFPVTVASTLK